VWHRCTRRAKGTASRGPAQVCARLEPKQRWQGPSSAVGSSRRACRCPLQSLQPSQQGPWQISGVGASAHHLAVALLVLVNWEPLLVFPAARAGTLHAGLAGLAICAAGVAQVVTALHGAKKGRGRVRVAQQERRPGRGRLGRAGRGRVRPGGAAGNCKGQPLVVLGLLLHLLCWNMPAAMLVCLLMQGAGAGSQWQSKLGQPPGQDGAVSLQDRTVPSPRRAVAPGNPRQVPGGHRAGRPTPHSLASTLPACREGRVGGI